MENHLGMLRLVFKTSDTRRLAIRMWWARQDAILQPVGHAPTALTIELQAPPGRF